MYYVAISDYVKIGFTTRLKQRLHALRVPVDHLLAVEYGNRLEESLRHEEFGHLRISARWENFRRGDDLMAHIERLREENGIPGWLTVKRGRSGPVTVRRIGDPK